MRLKVQNSIGVNTMKVKLMKAKLKHVCNQKEFIWGVRVSGLILGIIDTHLIMFHQNFFMEKPVLSFLLFGTLGMTEYKVHYKEMSDMKRTAVVFGFLALYVLVGGMVYIVGCPKRN